MDNAAINQYTPDYFVPCLPKTGVSGATRWVNPDKGFKGNAVQTFKSRSQSAETEMVFKVV